MFIGEVTSQLSLFKKKHCICRGCYNLCDFAFQDLEQRHNTILQMYGEKAEEAEELRLDLEDVKNMYKTQIDELLQNQK